MTDVASIPAAPEAAPSLRVVREPRTYEKHGPHSFFHDLARVAYDREPRALARLEQHRHESLVDKQTAKPTSEQKDRLDEAQVEYRTNPRSALGTGGEFDPPAWLIPLFASAGRAGRPLADLIGTIPLPAGVSSVHIPRITTGSLTGVQTDGGPAASQDMVSADAKSTVVTIAGHQDVSVQLLEQTPAPGLDFIVATDLAKAYNKNLEAQLISGTGGTVQVPGTQLNGLTNITGTTSVSGSGANTIAAVWPLLGQAAAGVGNNRLLPPQVWLMAPRRLFWVLSSTDSSNRPIGSPGQSPQVPSFPDAGGAIPFGPIVGLPAYLDGAIAAGTSADSVFCVRPDDMFLWESQPRFLTAMNPLAGTLQVRLSMHCYAAAVLDRYPNGIGIITSIPQPTNF